MKTITIYESDFDINDQNSIIDFNRKLQDIKESFEVKFDFPMTKIPLRLFANTNIEKIALPSSVTEIGISAFAHCYSLTEITIPDSVAKINESAFCGCTSLENITLPTFITKINDYVFVYCDSLENIIIPMSEEKFLSTVEGAENFLNEYEDIISFEDKSLDALLLKNNSLESVINNLEER